MTPGRRVDRAALRLGDDRRAVRVEALDAERRGRRCRSLVEPKPDTREVPSEPPSSDSRAPRPLDVGRHDLDDAADGVGAVEIAGAPRTISMRSIAACGTRLQ